MSNNRYLEVTSAYRNRNEYPNPAEFVIPFAKTGLSGVVPNGVNAKDAVANAYPFYAYHGCPTNKHTISTP